MGLDSQEAREERQLPVPVTEETAPSANVARRLHPIIYETIAGLALVFVIAAWGGFFATDYTYYVLAVMTGFIFVAVFLPFQLYRVRRHGHDPRDISLSHRSLWGWLHAEVEIRQGRIKGSQVAAGILMPVAAAAISMVCFAIVLHFDIG